MTYSIPPELRDNVSVGTWVYVSIRKKRLLGVVERVGDLEGKLNPEIIVDIEGVADFKKVSAVEISFWKTIADYYLCTVGEVFKAACSSSLNKQLEKKRTRVIKKKQYKINSCKTVLNDVQKKALSEIEDSFSRSKTTLLVGVTGSGKTEIYIELAEKTLSLGKNVLYLVPEIALSRQLEERLERVFQEKLLVWHSSLTPAKRKSVYDRVVSSTEDLPYIVLGTRSSVFLPMHSLGLIIVDEEHDVSYKQKEPSPRYNGRDVAMLLGAKTGANVILGSATPSLESFYNVETGKYCRVDLPCKYFNANEAEPEIIDMRKALRLNDVKGSFSMKLINMISEEIANKRQVMVFRSRRAYSSYVQCSECGDVPKCPHCNVALSYHKFSNVLECHYCGYKRKFASQCKACGKDTLLLKGAGTERLEEELHDYFPNAVVARLDGDVSSSKLAEEKVLTDFTSGKIDILVGTQIVSKGFDFPGLSLVAVINADAMLSLQNFRADEQTFQLLRQLSGRAGRRGESGKFVVQTYQPEHKVFEALCSNNNFQYDIALEERRQFGFPPYCRLVEVSIRDYSLERLKDISNSVSEMLVSMGLHDFYGPIVPQIDKVRGRNVVSFLIKLPRTSKSQAQKKVLADRMDEVTSSFKPAADIVIDVDPI